MGDIPGRREVDEASQANARSWWSGALAILGLLFAVPGLINDLGDWQVAACFVAAGFLVAAVVKKSLDLRRTGRFDMWLTILWSATVLCAVLLGSAVGNRQPANGSAAPPQTARSNEATTVPAPSPPASGASSPTPESPSPSDTTESPTAPPAAPASTPTLLRHLPIIDSDGSWKSGTATLDTRAYTDSVIATCHPISQEAGFNLERKYLNLKATIGLPDTAGTGAETRFIVIVDGVVKLSRAVSLGEPVPVTVDVTGGLRMVLRVERPSGCSEAVWGSASISVR